MTPAIDEMELLRGFVGGAIAGWAQVFVMQPFEIIKVRLVNQSLFNPQYLGIRHCATRIFREEGPLAFYKGTSLPIQAPSFPSSATAFRDQWPSEPTSSSRTSSPSSIPTNTHRSTASCRCARFSSVGSSPEWSAQWLWFDSFYIGSCRPHPNSVAETSRNKSEPWVNRGGKGHLETIRGKGTLPRLPTYLRARSAGQLGLLLLLLVHHASVRQWGEFSPSPLDGSLSGRRSRGVQFLAVHLPNRLHQDSDAVARFGQTEVSEFLALRTGAVRKRGLQSLLQGTGHHHVEVLPRQRCGLLLLRVRHAPHGMEEALIYCIFNSICLLLPDWTKTKIVPLSRSKGKTISMIMDEGLYHLFT